MTQSRVEADMKKRGDEDLIRDLAKLSPNDLAKVLAMTMRRILDKDSLDLIAKEITRPPMIRGSPTSIVESQIPTTWSGDSIPPGGI